MKEKLKHLPLIFNALVILSTGFDILDQARPFGYVFVAGGAVYFVLAFLTLRGTIKNERVAELLGAVMFTATAVDFYLQGRHGLPFAYLTAALVSAFLPNWIRSRRERAKPTPPSPNAAI